MRERDGARGVNDDKSEYLKYCTVWREVAVIRSWVRTGPREAQTSRRYSLKVGLIILFSHHTQAHVTPWHAVPSYTTGQQHTPTQPFSGR